MIRVCRIINMDEIKNIVSIFIKKNANEIDQNTLINQLAIPGSVLIHRMYATLDKAGYQISTYNNINTYGELLSSLGLHGDIKKNESVTTNTAATSAVSLVGEKFFSDAAIGIDIESVDNLPKVDDFREDAFYVNNFSPKEISYCLLKADPYETFAGLFSAKEALCKANNKLIGIPFNQIAITHDIEGKPFFKGYAVSISHTKQFSVAIAMAQPQRVENNLVKEISQPVVAVNEEVPAKKSKKTIFLSLVILILIFVIVYLLFKRLM